RFSAPPSRPFLGVRWFSPCVIIARDRPAGSTEPPVRWPRPEGVTVVRVPLTPANLSDPVTEHLRQDFTKLSLGQTVGEALDWLRAHPPPGQIIYLYVVDQDSRLCGVVPTRRLLLSAPDAPLADIMVRAVVALPAGATVLEACEFFIQHRFLAFPVVDGGRRVLGVVGMELYADELRNLEDADEREVLFQLIGVHLADR